MGFSADGPAADPVQFTTALTVLTPQPRPNRVAMPRSNRTSPKAPPADWSSLPPGLAYLIPSLKAVARQSADRIGSGDVEFGRFKKDWKTRSKGMGEYAEVSKLHEDGERLRKWLDLESGFKKQHRDAGLALADHVLDSMMYEFWDGLGSASIATDIPPRPPPLMFDLPKGIKFTSSSDGFGFRSRSVVVTVIPGDATTFQSNMRSALTLSDGHKEMLPPGLAYNRSNDFKIGPVRGVKVTCQWAAEPTPFCINYVLEVPGGFAQVQMIAAGKRKCFDMAAIEPFIATIRFETDPK